MQIFLRFAERHAKALRVSESMSGLALKDEVCKQLGIPCSCLSLSCSGKLIIDSPSLGSQGIKKHSTVEVNLKLKGGGCGSSKSANVLNSTKSKSVQPRYQVPSFKRGEDPAHKALETIAGAVERNDNDEALRGIQKIEQIKPEDFRNPNLVAAKLIEIFCSKEAEGIDQAVKDKLFAYIPKILNVMLQNSDLFTLNTKTSLLETIENSLDIIKLDKLGGSELKFHMEMARNMIETFPSSIELAYVLSIIKDVASFGMNLFKLEVPLNETFSLGEKVFKWLRGKVREKAVKSFYELYLTICILSNDQIDEAKAEIEIRKLRNYTTKDSIRVGTILLIQKLIMKISNPSTLDKLKNILTPLLSEYHDLLPVVLRICIELNDSNFPLKKEFQAWWGPYFTSNLLGFKSSKSQLVEMLIERNPASYLQKLNEDRTYLAGISYELYQIMKNDFEIALKDVNYVELSVTESKAVKSTLYELNLKINEFLFERVEKVCIAFGDSGSGKSIYCNKLAHDLLSSKSEYLPIYAYLPIYKYKVEGDLTEAVLRKYNIQLTDDLKSRKILFILDAYDELNSKPNIIVSNFIMETFKNSKVLFTCRTNEAPPNLNAFASKDAMGKAEKYLTLYIQPLSKESIEHYAKKVVELKIGWNSFDELWNIINRTEVLQLLSNPFLLAACLKNPAILNNLYAQNSKIDTLRTYQEYITVYQTNEYERIYDPKYYREEMQEIYTETSIEYAFIILEKGNLSRADISRNLSRADISRKEINRGCLLKESSNKNNTFLHPSIGDYFVAYGVIKIAKEWNSTKDLEKLNRVELMERYKVLDFIKEMMNECFREDKRAIQESLFRIVRLRDPNFGLASSNAISILNYCGKSFHNQNLSGIYIKKANLRYSCLINANLNGSNLENANLTQANLRRAQMKNCNLIGVTLGIQYRDMKHLGCVNSVFVSSDNRYILSGSYDKTIKLWDLETGDLKYTLKGHSNWVNSVFVSRDNRHIVSGSKDRTIRVWELETGELKYTQAEHSGFINSVFVSSDNRYIVSGSEDKTIKVWDLETGNLKNTLQGHLNPVNSVFVSSDNRYIVSGDFDAKIIVWVLETGELKYTQEEHSSFVNSVFVSSDNRYIVSGSRDATIKVWELETGSLKHTLQGHSSSVRSVFVSSDSRYIVSGSDDKTIKVWELETGNLNQTIQGHSNCVTSVVASSDNRYIVSGSSDQAIKVWELEAGELKPTLQGHSNWVYSVFVSSDNQYIVSGSADETIKVWELETGDLKHTLKGHSSYVHSVFISRDNRYIVSGSADETIKVWKLKTGKLKHTLKGHSDVVNSVFVLSDNRYIVSGSKDKTIKVWNLETGAYYNLLEYSHWIFSVFVSSDNRYIVSGSADEIINVWEFETGNFKHTLLGHSNYVNSIFVSSDNRYVASGSADETIKVWDLETGELKHTLQGHSLNVTSVFVSSDNRYIVSASNDKTINLWELETGNLKHTLQGHSSSVRSVFVSSDSRYIVSGSDDKTIKVWELDSADASKTYQMLWTTYEGICAIECNFKGSKLSRELETTIKYYQSNRF
jgi:WD40 repeat protein